MKIFTITFILLMITTSAQENAALNVNRLYLPFDNKGVLADVDFESQGSMGKYDGKGVLLSGGFLLSQYGDSRLWANGVLSSFRITDYQAGKIGSSPRDSINVIYSVKYDDPAFGESWQRWSEAVEQGAYFYDGDNDSIYTPVDKNGNGMWDTNEDKPDILYDETYFTVYNDGVPYYRRRFNTEVPVGIEIRQTIFASGRNENLEGVVFVRYSILYKGLDNDNSPDTLNNIVFSIAANPDIGETQESIEDDRAGSDIDLRSGYVYNNGGDSFWGDNPPAIFQVLLQGPRIKTLNPIVTAYNRLGPLRGVVDYQGFRNSKLGAYTVSIEGDPILDVPDNAWEARFTMTSYAVNGQRPDPCDETYGVMFGSIDCDEVDPRMWFNGYPEKSSGWIAIFAEDVSNFISSENFSLIKNEPMDIIVAYVVGQGQSPLTSVKEAREITQYVHEEYERNFSTISGVENEPEEVVNTFSLSQNYPNPFNPTTTIQYTIPNVGNAYDAFRGNTKLIVYDILGRQVKTLVNEVKAPGSYEVTFDASQLASGVYFYRLTSGSFNESKKMLLIK